MGDLERQVAKKLESQPSVSNAGIFAQQADYRTEFWRKGLGEMDQAVEMEPQNALPFRFVSSFHTCYPLATQLNSRTKLLLRYLR